MFDSSACPDQAPWTHLAIGPTEVLVHRATVTTLGARGVRTCDRFDWFWGRAGGDRWVVFHRSEHHDAVTAGAVLRRTGRDMEWQEQLLGRRQDELFAAPVAVADLQRAAIAGLQRSGGTRLRTALPEERPEIAGLAPLPGERPPAPEELPPLVTALPADPAADRLVLAEVLPERAARRLNRQGLTTLQDLARLSDVALAELPGVDDQTRREALAALRRHGLLLAPDRSSVADLRERRDGRRRQAARFAELLQRGYGVEQIAEHARRSVGYVRMVLGDRAA
ncbi:hypothetical protein [Patulibacter sp.]|uniref:hypothetical protein n=1 Tax=Patulibacter sp. TaxID=1912859 RepID=UPI00271AE432|nr:hypothetical protein [Patulibacter sp.]MDO9408267.1 hypothetical protein [Patulibacter sp.]